MDQGGHWCTTSGHPGLVVWKGKQIPFRYSWYQAEKLFAPYPVAPSNGNNLVSSITSLYTTIYNFHIYSLLESYLFESNLWGGERNMISSIYR